MCFRGGLRNCRFVYLSLYLIEIIILISIKENKSRMFIWGGGEGALKSKYLVKAHLGNSFMAFGALK